MSQSKDSSSNKQTEWIVLQGKIMDGPYSTEAVLAKLASGEVSFSDHAWRPGLAKWVRIGDCHELDRRRASPQPAAAAASAPAVDPAAIAPEDLIRSVHRAHGPLWSQDEAKPDEAAGDDLVGPAPWMKTLGVFLGMALFGSPAHSASVLEIVSLKATLQKPVLVFKTDATQEEIIKVKVKGQSGEILSLPSFYRQFEIRRQAGEIPTLDLTSMKLPEGLYHVTASIGSLEKSSSFFLGIKSPKFDSSLARHLKGLSSQQQAEKMTLFYAAQKMENLAGEFSTHFQQAKSTGGGPWIKFYTGWKKRVEEARRPLKRLLKSPDVALAYPEEIRSLSAAVEKMMANAVRLDVVVHQKREIAQDVTAENLGEEFARMKTELSILSAYADSGPAN